MIIDGKEFTNKYSPSKLLTGEVYRYCTFSSFSVEGPQIEGAFLDCTFSRLDLYWAFFNCAVIVSCKFEDCVFRGASFRGCKVVDSEFLRCRFVLDNLGGSCASSDTHWYGCTATDCEGWEALMAQ